MAQHDYFLDNAPGAAFRSDLNDALAAIATSNAGPTAPGSPFANMVWFDTTNNLLKMRNATNSAWITIASKSGNNWIPYRLGVALGTASVQPDTRYAHRSNNLSDLANAGTARNNLGLGTAAVRAAEDTLTDGANLPDGAAVKAYVDAQVAGAQWGYSQVTTPSGVAHAITTAIPAGVREVEIILDQVSLNTGDNLLVQIGNASSYVTTGYTSTGQRPGAAGATATDGFVIVLNNAANAFSGVLRAQVMTGTNVWVSDHTGSVGGDRPSIGGGRVNMSGDISRVRITSTGAASFDGGTIQARWK
jgi:hypothetical protein